MKTLKLSMVFVCAIGTIAISQSSVSRAGTQESSERSQSDEVTMQKLITLGYQPSVAGALSSQKNLFIFVTRRSPEIKEAAQLQDVDPLAPITVFRGIRLRNAASYNVDFDLFPTSKNPEPNGSIYVTTKSEIADGYGSSYEDKPVSVIVKFQVPRAFLHDGKWDDAFRIYAKDLKEVGFDSLQPFIIDTKISQPSR